MPRTSVVVICAYLLSFCAPAMADTGLFPIEAIAYFNQEAPGTSGASFDVFDEFPGIDQWGRVVFTGSLQGVGSVSNSNKHGIWYGSAGNVSLLGRETFAVPYPPQDRVFKEGSALNYFMAQGGQLGFAGISTPFQGSSDTRRDIMLEQGGTVTQFLYSGGPAPVIPGAILTGVGPFITHPSGQYAFTGFMANGIGGVTGANDAVLWAKIGGSTAIIAREGSPADGAISGPTWTQFNSVAVSSTGDVQFFGIKGANTGLWSSNGTTTVGLAVPGQQIPGFPVGTTFNTVDPQQVRPSANGNVAFQDNRVWLKDGTGYHLMAGVGSTVLGGGSITAINTNVNASDDGRVFFRASMGTAAGLFAASGAGIELIVKEGTQVPGQPAGTTYQNISNPAVNSAGLVAFISNLRDSGGNTTFDYLFATEPEGDIQMITGRSVELGPGDFQTIGRSSLLVDMFPGGALMQFNDANQLVFRAQLPSLKYAIYVAQIPEPSTLTAAMIALSVVLTRRRAYPS